MSQFVYEKHDKISNRTLVDDLKLISFPNHDANGSNLVVFEDKTITFNMKRIFTVRAEKGINRGNHAHFQCTQLLVCLQGAIEVLCDDGKSKKIIQLAEDTKGLLIPPLIWATQKYLKTPTILMVICDRPYEEEDYIRDYNQFLAVRNQNEIKK